MTMSIDGATPEEWYWAVKAVSEHNAMPDGADAPDCVNCWLTVPFGEVKPFFRLMAFALWQQGHPIEYRDDAGVWRATEQPLWGAQMVYRLLPKPEELVLPSIDWSAVQADLRWLSVDMSGVAHLTTARPHADKEAWLDGCCYAEAAGFASFKRGKGDWRKLIVQRPEGV